MKNKTILVVDDEPDIREILLLDIMMPNMSGLEVAEVWQKEENSPALIFLTALGEEEDVLRGFELGGRQQPSSAILSR